MEQATVLLDYYTDDAGELAAGGAMTLRDRGINVHFWKLLTADELLRSWDPGGSLAIIALCNYAPSQSVPFDAIQIRLHRSNGTLFVWDSRNVLTPTGRRADAHHQPMSGETGAT